MQIKYERLGDYEYITANGTAKEMISFVLGMQAQFDEQTELLQQLNEKADQIISALDEPSSPGAVNQETMGKMVSISDRSGSAGDRKHLANLIRKVLVEQIPDNSLQQQPFPTKHTQKRDEEVLLNELGRKSDTQPRL